MPIAIEDGIATNAANAPTIVSAQVHELAVDALAGGAQVHEPAADALPGAAQVHELAVAHLPGAIALTKAGDQYTGLDRFGRVVEQKWYNNTTATTTDDFKYGYDRDSSVLWRTNEINHNFDELYHPNGSSNHLAWNTSSAERLPGHQITAPVTMLWVASPLTYHRAGLGAELTPRRAGCQV